jgi:hypothetical protein
MIFACFQEISLIPFYSIFFRFQVFARRRSVRRRVGACAISKWSVLAYEIFLRETSCAKPLASLNSRSYLSNSRAFALAPWPLRGTFFLHANFV